MNIEGVDISYHQGKIDWRKLKEKAQFAYIRAGWGVTKDIRLDENIAGANSVGMPFGNYHYFMPKINPIEQADAFQEWIGNFVDDVYHPFGVIEPALDCEESGLPALGVSQSAYGSAIHACLTAFESVTGLDESIYTSSGFWDARIGKTTWGKEHALWLASWNLTYTLPRDWAGTIPLFWQYAVRADGREWGMSGKGLDHDYFIGTYEDFNRRYETIIIPPQPPPIPDAVTIKKGVSLNIRNVPNDAINTSIIGNTGKRAKWLVEDQTLDLKNRGYWYQVGRGAWIAGWLCDII